MGSITSNNVIWLLWLLPIIGAGVILIAKPDGLMRTVDSVSDWFERTYQRAKDGSGIFANIKQIFTWTFHLLHNWTSKSETPHIRTALRLGGFGLALSCALLVAYLAYALVVVVIGLFILGKLFGGSQTSPTDERPVRERPRPEPEPKPATPHDSRKSETFTRNCNCNPRCKTWAKIRSWSCGCVDVDINDNDQTCENCSSFSTMERRCDWV